jgi:hypothetical protein
LPNHYLALEGWIKTLKALNAVGFSIESGGPCISAFSDSTLEKNKAGIFQMPALLKFKLPGNRFVIDY